ncbi:PIP5K9, partial [Symbiodinium pilosum]
TAPTAPNAVAAKRAVEVAKDAANAEYNKQKYDRAVEGYTKAAASDPCLVDVAAIFSNLAHCRLCLGQPHCAIAAAISCLRLRPSWAVAVKAAHRLAAALACTGEHEAADQVIQRFDGAATDDVPENVRKQCMDVLGKLDRHVMALKELRAENGPGLWEAHADASLAGSEWCSAGALEVKGSHLRTVSHCPQGSLLLLMRPLGGLVKGTHGWSVREASKDHICSDGVGLPERLSHICNTDIAAKEVALLMAGALDRVQHPQALLLCSPRVQLLPLLGQRLESFFRAFGTLGPSLVDGIVEDHRIKLRPS